MNELELSPRITTEYRPAPAELRLAIQSTNRVHQEYRLLTEQAERDYSLATDCGDREAIADYWRVVMILRDATADAYEAMQEAYRQFSAAVN